MAQPVMKRLSPAQRLQIVQLYYENQCSVRNVFRALRTTYGQHNRPTERTIRYTIEKLETQFTLLDNTRPIRSHPASSEENIEAVAKSLRSDRDESIRRRSKQLGLSYSTTWRILHNNLKVADSEDKRKGSSKKKGAEAPVEAPPAKKAAVVSNDDDAPLPAKSGKVRPVKASGSAAHIKLPVPHPPKNRRKKKETEAIHLKLFFN